ncbi:fungal specific transcription factor domain-containing protein 57 [Elsinoe australis]|uniref:Fungal specific transcription factor domain-containing protein 57 n=1 Tax=Elsinoe australis TaxID=40998 RepID=A0A4U7APV5_9PEZI|nr:fungal specific transcription factor domain-containing protein 57 [Elsinoe australis]
MSETLTSEVHPKKALYHLTQLDNECESANPDEQILLQRGPFGAFRVDTGKDISKDLIETPLAVAVTSPPIVVPDAPSNDWFSTALSPWSPNKFFGLFDQCDQPQTPLTPLTPFSIDINDFIHDEDRVQEIFDDAPVGTYADVHKSLDHASLSAFYGTLAISALSLGGVLQSQMWLERGMEFKQRAREHTRIMLKTAYDMPKRAKYKSILIALLTMVRISIISGNRDQAECYLLESEKFIRLKGLHVAAKSRKRRLLHHCYAFERFLHESTCMYGMNHDHRRHVRNVVQMSGMRAYGEDSTSSFRLPVLRELDKEMMEVKSREEGENDLHLEKPGIWTASLYEEIFGCPEEWFQLLSLVIRLGNEKDAGETIEEANAILLHGYHNRAKGIEKRINQLQTNSKDHGGEVSEMLTVMKKGLFIYFYRRIHDVDASFLQPSVVMVRDYLVNRSKGDIDDIQGSFTLSWTAFVAGCEAQDSSVQRDFADWFRKAAHQSGLSSFSNTLSMIEKVWAERESLNGVSRSWLDMIKNDAMLRQHL